MYIFSSSFWLSYNTMQEAEAAYLKGLHVKSGIFAQLTDFLSAIYFYITLACKMYQRHFNGVAEPAHCCGSHGHITKHKSSAWTKHTAHTVKKVLWIRVSTPQ